MLRSGTHNALIAASHIAFIQVLAWLLLKMGQAREALQGALGGLDEEAQQAYVIGFLVGSVRMNRWHLGQITGAHTLHTSPGP